MLLQIFLKSSNKGTLQKYHRKQIEDFLATHIIEEYVVDMSPGNFLKVTVK